MCYVQEIERISDRTTYGQPPANRTEVSPPFTNIGFDVYGPWTIHSRKTRGGTANSKRWGLVFTCLSSRAIHIKLLESKDASSFICAIRRFLALRGPVSILRCDGVPISLVENQS